MTDCCYPSCNICSYDIHRFTHTITIHTSRVRKEMRDNLSRFSAMTLIHELFLSLIISIVATFFRFSVIDIRSFVLRIFFRMLISIPLFDHLYVILLLFAISLELLLQYFKVSLTLTLSQAITLSLIHLSSSSLSLISRSIPSVGDAFCAETDFPFSFS